METPLVQILKNKMNALGITIPDLERKASLKTNAVRNITLGRSKNPNIETLKALAKALECTLEDLMASEHPDNHIMSGISKNRIEDAALYTQVVDQVLKEYYKKDIAPTIPRLNSVVLEVYFYFHSKKKDIDPDFIEWIVEKHL